MMTACQFPLLLRPFDKEVLVIAVPREGFLRGLKVLEKPLRVILTLKRPSQWPRSKKESIRHAWGDMCEYTTAQERSNRSWFKGCYSSI